MQFVITTNHGLTYETLAPWATWLIVIGAGYGALRLVFDVGRVLVRGLRAGRPAERVVSAERVAAHVPAPNAEPLPSGILAREREKARRRAAAATAAAATTPTPTPPAPHG